MREEKEDVSEVEGCLKKASTVRFMSRWTCRKVRSISDNSKGSQGSWNNAERINDMVLLLLSFPCFSVPD
ncbi:hypothetical protein HMI56_005542 [Coelomomyces lativittatus]|nr:hypothetical protein HMI56_005542 [Coelomomyces lativittatus]